MVTLRSTKLFEGLSAHDMEVVRRITTTETYPAGQVIFREGDPGDAVFVIQEGAVEIVSRADTDQRQVLSRLGPGSFFGEMAVLEFKQRSATAIAAQLTTVYRIPAGEMFTFLQHCPELGLALLREISSRLRDLNAQYVSEMIQAERLSLVGRFARSIVHDLKNPLSIIGLTAEMAGADTATPEFRRTAAARIRKQVDRINELVGEVLEFAQGTHQTTVPVLVNYAKFVEEVTNELRDELELRGVALHLEEAAPAVPMLIHPMRLQRVFHNLMHNAVQAMSGSGIIILRFHLKEARLITEIEDTGPGIPAEVAPKLFEPFASHGKKSGTGLGLSICKKIVEDHGGRIWTETRPARGAIFLFSLPRPK
jgi:signal transduction histidine kinase